MLHSAFKRQAWIIVREVHYYLRQQRERLVLNCLANALIKGAYSKGRLQLLLYTIPFLCVIVGTKVQLDTRTNCTKRVQWGGRERPVAPGHTRVQLDTHVTDERSLFFSGPGSKRILRTTGRHIHPGALCIWGCLSWNPSPARRGGESLNPRQTGGSLSLWDCLASGETKFSLKGEFPGNLVLGVLCRCMDLSPFSGDPEDSSYCRLLHAVVTARQKKKKSVCVWRWVDGW